MKTLILWVVLAVQTPPQNGTLNVRVRSDAGPVSQVEVQVNTQTVLTDERGEATLEVQAGPAEVRFHRVGFADKSQRAIVNAGMVTRLEVELESQSVLEEEIVVTATRANTRIEDEPIRVEVVDQEEVDE